MPSSDSLIQLPADSTGKKLRTRTGMTRATDTTTHQEVHNIGGIEGDIAEVTNPALFTDLPSRLGWGLGSALNVHPNAIQKASYNCSRVTADAGAPTAVVIVANTRKALMQVHHLAAATTTKRIRRIRVGALFGAAVMYSYEVYRVTAAPTGGTAITPTGDDPGDGPTSLVCTYLPAAGVSGAISGIPVAGGQILGAASGHAQIIVYDWIAAGEEKPLTIRAGFLEGFTLFVRGTGVVGPDPQIHIDFTEE